MIESDIGPIHEVTPCAVSQAISDVALPEDNSLSTWFFKHAPLILGSALGMFASNIFLYAFQNGGVRALWHVSLHTLSSLPSRIQMLAIAAPRSICATYTWTAQLVRHVYLLSLYALCQAVILPCLVGSLILGWAGRIWFGVLRVLYTAFRIFFTVSFGVLVVNTGLLCAVILASTPVTSSLRRICEWTIELHDAAVEFVSSNQSTLLHIHSHRADDQPGCSSTASTSRLRDPLIGPSPASIGPVFRSVPSRTKECAVTADFVMTHEVEVAREGNRSRFPVTTTLHLHLRITLADQRKRRPVGCTGSPSKVNVFRQSDNNDRRGLFDPRDAGHGWSVEARKDTPDDRRPRHVPGEAIESDRECFRKQIGSVAIPRVVRRNNGWASQDNPSPLRSPSVTSPAFWFPPGAATPEYSQASQCGVLLGPSAGRLQ